MNVKFTVATAFPLPWSPARRREAGELTYLRVGKLRRCVRYEHVQLISRSHSNVCSSFSISVSLCILALSLCLGRSLWIINSPVCLHWVKHEVSVCAPCRLHPYSSCHLIIFPVDFHLASQHPRPSALLTVLQYALMQARCTNTNTEKSLISDF